MSAASRLAITNQEFTAALRYALHSRNNVARRIKLGVAISGGVDSMALAFLVRRHLQEDSSKVPDFSAFIVDHQARAESTEEAHKVASALSDIIGKKPRIVTLAWPESIDPSRLQNFESQARHLRYQALAKACRDQNVTHLLLGHHADDVAETVLTRLADGHTRGLQGMAASTQIPECEGLHGIYESGQAKPVLASHDIPRHIESGGISITRPLLQFPKARLIKTCEDAGVAWVEDKTNQDPTFTRRNAARTLLGGSRLPLALRSESLLRVSDTIRRQTLQESRHVQRLMNACLIRRLDIRSGMLHIKLPAFGRVLNYDVAPSLDLDYKHRIAMGLVRHILDVVSPREIINLGRLAVLPGIFWPAEFAALPQPVESQDRITLGGVLIGRTKFRTKFERKSRPDTQTMDMEWFLSRQPYSRFGKLPLSIFTGNMASSELPCDSARATKFLSTYDVPDVQQSGFSLWDGRFWIHVAHKQPYPLLVAPLTAVMRNEFLNKHKTTKWAANFEKRLDECAMSSNRFILPAIIAPPGNGDVRQGAVLAVPTLGYIRPGWETQLSWDIRYKKIPFGNFSQDREHPYIWRTGRE